MYKRQGIPRYLYLMVLCLLCQNKIEVLRITAIFGWNVLTSVFSVIKKWAAVPLHFVGFQRFFQCSDGLNQGSGSGHKSRDPVSNAKCFFTNKKLSRGSPAFCRLFKFVQCFSQNLNIEESGSRRNFFKVFFCN